MRWETEKTVREWVSENFKKPYSQKRKCQKPYSLGKIRHTKLYQEHITWLTPKVNVVSQNILTLKTWKYWRLTNVAVWDVDLVSRASSHGFSARHVGPGPRREPEVIHSLCNKPFGQLALVQIKTAKLMLRHSPAQAIYRGKLVSISLIFLLSFLGS